MIGSVIWVIGKTQDILGSSWLALRIQLFCASRKKLTQKTQVTVQWTRVLFSERNWNKVYNVCFFICKLIKKWNIIWNSKYILCSCIPISMHNMALQIQTYSLNSAYLDLCFTFSDFDRNRRCKDKNNERHGINKKA